MNCPNYWFALFLVGPQKVFDFQHITEDTFSITGIYHFREGYFRFLKLLQFCDKTGGLDKKNLP